MNDAPASRQLAALRIVATVFLVLNGRLASRTMDVFLGWHKCSGQVGRRLPRC
jgi:hypothetical protein